MRKNTLIAFIIAVTPLLIFAQGGGGKLRGVVTDQETGEALVGANVILEGTARGASTDLNGVYVLLAIPAGTYTVQVSYIGYQEVALSNIRVSENQTTTQDFALSPAVIEVEALQIVAERPLIQRNTTNTVRITTQEDIQNMPIRGLQNLLALEAGTVLQDGELHIRGGRTGEVAYFIDGVSAINPMYNSENVTIIQEALEEVQMQAGGYTAEFGGGNSGIVRSTLRSGTSQIKGSADFRTDGFADPGEQFLGTSSYGYTNGVITLSGPLVTPKLRFFVAAQTNHMDNRNPSYVEPFDTKDFIDPATGQALGTLDSLGWLVDDGYEGRTVGEPLPDNPAAGPGHIAYKRNSLPGSEKDSKMAQGTLTFDLTNSIKLRLSGTYEDILYPTSGSNFYTNLQNSYFNADRTSMASRKRAMMGFRATHILNQTTFYELGVFYTDRSSRTYDPDFGDDWQAYSDSVANFEKFGATGWRSRYLGPAWISTINNFEMEPPGYPNNGYYKNNQTDVGVSVDFTSQVRPRWEVKAGGRYESWEMRQFSIGNIRQWSQTEHGVTGEDDYPWETVHGSNWEYARQVELSKASGASYFGYDIDGNETDEFPYGPNTPQFASGYLQNKIEYPDLVMNFGLRFEYIDTQSLKPEDPEKPLMDTKNDWLDPAGVDRTKPYTYILPRFNFSFPVTDRTVFYAQYGRYVQMPALWQVYTGYNQLSRTVSPTTRSPYGWWGGGAGWTAKPEEITQYELGLRILVSENFALTTTGFYKNYNNQLRIDEIRASGAHPEEIAAGATLFAGNVNEDFSTNKGVEFTLELRRTKRLAAKLNYTLSDTRGTGASSRSGDVVVSDVVTRYPVLMFPLDYHQPHRGSAMLDYRFSRGEGGIFEGAGVNLLMTFNSGHAYTKIVEPQELGQADPWDIGVRATRDPRGRRPAEPLNHSMTPWNFSVDLNVDKVFYLGGVSVDVYMHVLNLLDRKNVINVHPTTGTPEDDGWLRSAHAVSFIEIPQYEDFYRAINLDNRWGWQYATGKDFYGLPRQIRFGARVEF